MSRARKALWYVRAGEMRELWRATRLHLFSETTHLGLRLATDGPFPDLPRRLSLRVRQLEPHDVPLFDPSTRPAGTPYLDDLINSKHLLDSGFETRYVALTKNDEVCYLQFMIDSSQNAKLHDAYGDLVPPLAEDEVLLEGGFTLEQYRGRGIIMHVIPELARLARARGARSLLAYPGEANAPMVRALEHAGFVPFIRRREAYRLLRRRVTWERISPAERPDQ